MDLRSIGFDWTKLNVYKTPSQKDALVVFRGCNTHLPCLFPLSKCPLRRHQVGVCSAFVGRGFDPWKILEAMSCDLPVVTTILGLGDIKARPGEEICVADTAEDFAETVVTLLKSPEMAIRIGRNAREFVINHHSWEYAASQIEEIYNVIIDKRI